MNIRISDFTERKYAWLLRKALKSYRFISYEEAMKKGKSRFIVLRHDIDYSPNRSLSIARIENRLGIKATYCVQLGSVFYNVFEKGIKERLLKIKDMGHHIGLHFDLNLYKMKNIREVEKNILYEKGIIEKLLGTKIKSVSFHNPEKWLAKLRGFEPSGFINTYAGFFTENMMYISDSNGYWRFGRLQDVILSGKSGKLHILTHPVWWQKKAMFPWKRIERCINGRSGFMKRYYRDLLKDSNRENVGYEDSYIR